MRNLFKILRIYSIITLVIIMSAVSFYSCSPTRYVPPNKQLLEKIKIENPNKEVKNNEIETAIKQKPNRKNLYVVKLSLGVYNIFKTDKEKGVRNWITRVIGEPPVIFDQFETERSVSNIKSLLESQSYYDVTVDYMIDTAKYNKKKIILTYIINTGEPYIISKYNYDIHDNNILNLIIKDSINSLIQEKNKLNTETLQTERERLVKMLKSNGYYYFNINNIHYYADTTNTKNQVKLSMAIRKSFSEDNIDNNETFVPQTIRNIYIYPDYDFQIDDTKSYNENFDTVKIDGYNIIYYNNLKIKPSTLLQSCFIKIGEQYDIRNIEKTHRHLSNLKQFKIINIKLNTSEDVFSETQKEKYLDVHILLMPLKKQSLTLELEGTTTSGNIGATSLLSYGNRNLFKGAQNLSAKASLSFQTLSSIIEEKESFFFNTLEYGGELKLNIPHFVVPFYENYEFVKNHNPHTKFGISFNYQKRPEYTRSIANASYGYVWKSNKNLFVTHTLNPIELYLVKIFNFDPKFRQEIQNSFLKFSYEDQLLTVLSYNFLYNNQSLNRLQNFSILWFNIETSGNLLSGIYSLREKEKIGESYQFIGVNFSQFIKADIDYRFHQIFDKNRSLVYRTYFGTGFAYANSKDLPFIKKYFIGGANDIRAWGIRTLGPGEYTNPTSNIDKNGDIKLVLNMEYRFKIISLINGALFLDAGNVWSINKEDSRPGAIFDWNRFYKDIALGTGFGLRFDFSFFLIRLDFGVPIYNPMLQDYRWFEAFKNFKIKNFTLNFGINYPF